MLLNCGVGEDSWESLGLQEDPTSPSWRRSVLGVHWKDWCWIWNCNTLATRCKELTHLKRPWFWGRLKARGEGDDRGWDGWVALLTLWTWVWASSGSWWWTGKPGVLWSMGLWRVGHNWASDLNWTEFIQCTCCVSNVTYFTLCCSVTKLCPTLWEPMDWLQHTRLPCPSLSPGVCSNSCPLSQWCCLSTSSAATPTPCLLSIFPSTGSFPMSCFFTSGGQSLGTWPPSSGVLLC